ncbi:hypothetical protein F4780DRAFT_752193 [Xylariomycetidae sp. FL0641]|nr:hypothetical protein F4780DRAFT_752193 [Xylariomycetidae sp. FL0641]
MRDVMEDRDVLDGVNDALAHRIRIQDIERDARAYALNVLPEPPPAGGGGGGAAGEGGGVPETVVG